MSARRSASLGLVRTMGVVLRSPVPPAFRSALAHAFSLTISPNARRQNTLVALVNGMVAHTLADKVGADGEALQVIFIEYVPPALDIGIIFERLIHFEMVAPAGDFQAVKTKIAGLAAHFLKGQIRPLSGK